ncbi:MAG: hypothetical protein LRY41_03185 [Candidatus Pacebacteria bacterium]|nr:hypothetical protein [Candidatus Paceibacterota bacterium]MCD8528298.1 hypothetical protein [Candidatus Paceibacterota bacterium]
MTTFKDDRYGAAMHQDNEVVEALQALGYSLQQSRDALKDIPQDITSTQERIKRALGAMRP